MGRDTAGEMGEAAEQEEVSGDVVNNAVEVDPKNYREAMSSSIKKKWLKAMVEELAAGSKRRMEDREATARRTCTAFEMGV